MRRPGPPPGPSRADLLAALSLSGREVRDLAEVSGVASVARAILDRFDVLEPTVPASSRPALVAARDVALDHALSLARLS